MAFQNVTSRMTGAVAAATLAGLQYHFVKETATGIAACSTLGGMIHGVLEDDDATAINMPCTVATGGQIKVEAGAANAGVISVGDLVSTDATGHAMTSITKYFFYGVCVGASSAAGECATIQIGPTGYVP